MWTRFDKFDSQIFGCFPCTRSGKINLTLNQLLLLFLQLINKIIGHFQNHGDKRSRDRLLHQVLKLNFLSYQVHSCTCLLKQHRVQTQSHHTFRVFHLFCCKTFMIRLRGDRGFGFSIYYFITFCKFCELPFSAKAVCTNS